jgi:hypothetical protein
LKTTPQATELLHLNQFDKKVTPNVTPNNPDLVLISEAPSAQL